MRDGGFGRERGRARARPSSGRQLSPCSLSRSRALSVPQGTGKQIIGIDEREAKLRANSGPGQYKLPSGIGAQVESRYRQNGMFSMHGGGRDFVKQGAADEPGPGKYNVDGSRRIPNAAVFGTGPARTTESLYEKRPGPKYKAQDALGTQVSSRYKTMPQCSFGAR